MTKIQNHAALRANPCLKEQQQSMECLNKMNYDNSKCQDYFDNYNICKKFWGKVYSDRRAKGLIPYLPEPEDREQIKAEFFGTKH